MEEDSRRVIKLPSGVGAKWCGVLLVWGPTYYRTILSGTFSSVKCIGDAHLKVLFRVDNAASAILIIGPPCRGTINSQIRVNTGSMCTF